MTSKTIIKPTTTVADLTAKLAQARAKLQALLDAESQVHHAAHADMQNGGRASEIDRFRTEQMELLREPLATARAECAAIRAQLDAIENAAKAQANKARHADLDATIELDRKELARCHEEVKRLKAKRADIETQLSAARSHRLQLADDAEKLIHAQGLALSDGGSFDDAKVQALRADSTHQADRVMAYEVAVKALDVKIGEARDNVIMADRQLTEMLGIKRHADDQKLLAKLIKAAGSASELGRVVVDAIGAGGLPKPNSAWKLGG